MVIIIFVLLHNTDSFQLYLSKKYPVIRIESLPFSNFVEFDFSQVQYTPEAPLMCHYFP
jgi:hypothetical protein